MAFLYLLMLLSKWRGLPLIKLMNLEKTFCVDKSAQVSSKLKLQLFPVDETTRRALEKVMYKPIRDSKGIPGAKSLVVCLNGYQREDRDDIMTIVSLMGAKFSNPLVANKVTHLICYKFEEKLCSFCCLNDSIYLLNHIKDSGICESKSVALYTFNP
ncbi:BRCT domain-containing protein At4g02110-like isoform X3 [Apium graveolens]|uniref:BRCT domain-containing protein At4g02110-like isoform X3 n=1 Tax=Apium graveolens TaxID=4045 RepID=UPI003D7BBAB3